MRVDIQRRIESRLKVIQLDECVVTKKTFNTHVWTLPRNNVTLDQRETYTQAKAVILAISRERGLESVLVFEKSINKQKFKVFLD